MSSNFTNDTQSTSRREEIDPIFKFVLIFGFDQLNVPLQTQVEVSRLPRTMDALAVLKRKADIEKVRNDTPFHYFLVYNQIEFKGKNDRLTIAGLRLILGRANLYMGENKIPVSKMTVTIICARKPMQVLLHSQAEVSWKPLGSGYYQSKDKLPVNLIVINELDIIPKNYPLLLFASSKRKFREFLQDAINRNSEAYVAFAYLVEPKIAEEVTMNTKFNLPQKKLEDIANVLGARLAPFLKEDILRCLSPEERLEGLSPQKRLEGLRVEEILSGLNDEKRKQLQLLLETQHK
ncbi:hypothetical protein H8E77_16635 [bacterium]|nr:hypothetical protein [bacterium]